MKEIGIGISGQVSEHDIHFESHVTVADQTLSETVTMRSAIEALLGDRFDINHATQQIEALPTSYSTVDLL